MTQEVSRRYEVYKDSGFEWLGEIPEHWELKRLKETIVGVDCHMVQMKVL